MIYLHLFRELVCQISPHPFGVICILTEDNGLGKSIRIPQKSSDPSRYQFRPFFKNERPVKIFLIIDPILDQIPVFISFTIFRTPSFQVFVYINPQHPERSQKPVFNALSE